MDPLETLRRVAADRRSGATALAVRAGAALARIEDPRRIRAAAGRVLRAHPAMAPLWRLFAAALAGGAAAAASFAERLDAETDAIAAAAAGWAVPNGADVLTHSASGTVAATLRAARGRIRSVACTVSLPGGEGRALAARLRRERFDARTVHDAAIGPAAAGASVVLVGADMVTDRAVINKVGTLLVALAAREHGVACYALAGQATMMPHEWWRPERAPAYEETPLDLFDAIVTERGPRRPAAVRRAAAAVAMPASLRSALR